MSKQEYRRLMKSVELLGSPKEEQINYLMKLGTFPSSDELALEFDDAFTGYKGMLSEGSLKELNSCNSQLNEIYHLLKIMSESHDPELWSVESLGNDQWEEIRSLAKSILTKVKDD